MTANEHIYAVKNILNRGVASDDTRISSRLILHYLNVSRGMLIHRKLNKFHNISEHSFISVCVPLELSSYLECSCVPKELDCKILKSTCKIPTDIIPYRGMGLTLKTFDGSVISPSSITMNNNMKYSRSKMKEQLGWFIENNYLFVLNDTELPVVIMKGIFQNPQTLDNFCDCGKSTLINDCYSFTDQEYPIDPELVAPMYEMALNFLRSAYSFPVDTQNNTQDDASIVPIQQ